MKNAHRGGSGNGMKIGHRGRALRAAGNAAIAAAALLGTFASVSSAQALTTGAGGGIVVSVPLLDASVTLPVLPSIDAGSVSLPVPGTDAGIVITLPLLPTTDAGTISLPLFGEDGGVVSLPGLGTDAGVALLCDSDATCGAGFSCFAGLGLCLPDTDGGSATGSEGSGSGTDTGSGSGSAASTVTGSGSVSAGSSADGGAATGSTTGSASASTADAGTATDGEEPGDQNGVSCSMSSGSKTSTAVPFELLVGFVALGAMRRRTRRSGR